MRGLRYLVALGLLISGAASAASLETVSLWIEDGDLPAEGAVLRLVPMPEGAGSAEVRIAYPDGGAPEPPGDRPGVPGVRALPPMTMRGVRLLPIVVTDPVAGELRLEIAWGADKHLPPANAAARSASRGFHEALRPLLAGEEKSRLAAGREGAYLVITAPEFLSAIQPLVAWKREKGFEVRVATTGETGVDRNQIRAYIGDLYRNAPVPPQFVLLVGDIEFVPAFDFHGVVSDLQFALQEGDDFLPDLDVGRLSVRDPSQAATVVAKILRHERDPYRGDAGNGAWMGRGLVVGADYASTTPVAVSRWIRRTLLGLGWSQVDSVYFPPHHGSGTALISARVNAGASLVTYRGWAYGPQGWDRPTFLSNHVAGLNNGWMLPVVMSFVCLNNKYDEPECFGEAWLRAGTAEAPRGAVAFIGNGEHWSHTRFNDAAAIGAITTVQQEGTRRLGDILNAMKLNILRQFPLEIPYESEAGESVEFYFYIYNLLGDPEMTLWAGPPTAIDVSLPAEVAPGTNFLDLAVTATGTGRPVEGVRVAVSRGDALLGTDWTSAAGTVSIPFGELAAGDPLRVAVTGANVQPRRFELPVVERARLLLAGVARSDGGGDGSTGNGDGVPNPGETLALRLTLRNPGATALTGLEARLALAGGAGGSLPPGPIPLGTLQPGEARQLDASFLYAVPATAEGGFTPHFRLGLAGADGFSQTIGLSLGVEAPVLRYAAHELTPALRPGGTSSLRVTLKNEGTLPGNSVSGVLRSLDPAVLSVVDSTVTYGTVAAGGSADGADGFALQAAADALPGAVANLKLVATTAEGYVSEASFAVAVGTADHTTPLGPDAYGYWIYDNTDTDYPRTAPLYEWTEISPAYGGRGTALALDSNLNDFVDPNETQLVDLPFRFQYYGQSYDQMIVGDNGWVSFDLRKTYDFYNWSLPNNYGNLARICPFWDNLMPGKRGADGLLGDGVYTWHDESNHRFIVEWSRIGNTDQPATPPNPSLFFTDLQTFQVILHDPAERPTPTGDGVIEFRYKQILNVDRGRMYASVGLEDPTGTIGLEYTYSNQYPPQAAPLNPGLAIRITTEPPVYEPFGLAEFRSERAEGSIALSWRPVDERPRGRYQVYRAPDGSTEFRPLPGAALDGSARGFLDRTADPERRWSYWIGSRDPVGRETISGPFAYDPARESRPSLSLSLSTVGANPSRAGAELAWSVPAAGEVRLAIHDVTGRLVRTLVRGVQKSGAGVAVWDGRDEDGRRVPAGTYWARIDSGGETRRVRLTQIR